MPYSIGESIHVLSIINGNVVYWYTGTLLAPEFKDNNISTTVWFIETQDKQIYKIDTEKIITVPANTYKLPKGTFSAEDICRRIGLDGSNSSEIEALNAFHILNIDLETKRVLLRTSGDKRIILPITKEQLSIAQRHLNASEILSSLQNTIKPKATEKEIRAANILLQMKGAVDASASSSVNELPSLFIQFDYK